MNARTSKPPNRTLRSQLEEYRSQGTVHSLREAVGIIVPLAVELAQRHASGEVLFLHPSSIQLNGSGYWQLSQSVARLTPVLARDKACLAPEERAGSPGNARSSVFGIGAVLYELVSGQSVGPAMRRPTEVVPGLPPEIDMVLAKALVADASHRPDDLKALAQAIHHLAPADAPAPPPADESHLNHNDQFEVDVRMSMVNMEGALGGAGTPYEIAVRNAPAARATGIDQATEALTELKQRLESDPRPRYVVIKEGMDHGPFNAVELLQQIASHTFEEQDLLRDTFSNDDRPIGEWEEFAPFADHARRHRVIAAEKVAIQATVEQEKKSTRGKAFLGLSLVAIVLLLGTMWFLKQAGRRRDEVAVQTDTATNVDSQGDLNLGKKGGGKGHRVVGESGGVPLLAGGMSCESAQAAYVEEINIGGSKVPADITSAQYGSILNGGGYLNGCGLSGSMGVDVCVAVQNGHAVGVTVRTQPHNGSVASCIASHVRGISFPVHPKLDVTRTHFAAQ